MTTQSAHSVILRRFAKATLLATGASLLIAHGAGAQAAAKSDPSEAAELSEVVVTGTSIRGAAPVGSALTAVTREEIKASGAVSVVQILQKTPSVFNVGVSETSRGQTGGSSNITYGSSINIRGLSPYATLTLINGHRMVQQEARAETVDPSHIPTNMLQRVEIVADGGSAIYGSEAIAGVANLILRRRVEGVEVGVRYGESNLGYQEKVGQVTVGHVWDSGQVTAGIEYMHKHAFSQSKLSYNDRFQIPFGGQDIRSTSCQPGNVQIGTTFYPIPAGGVTPATASGLVAGAPNRCSTFLTADALPTQERKSFAMTFDQNITEKLHMNAEAYVSKRNFKLTAVPNSITVTVPSTNAFYVAPAGVTVPLCSAAVNTTFGTPTGTRCETVLYNVANDVGIESALYGYSRVYEGTLGFTYDLPKDWQLAADFTYGFNTDRNYDRSNARTNAANLNRALASSNPTTAFNVFGGRSDPSVVTSTSPTGIFNQLFDTGGHTIIKVQNYKVDGPLFTLPGGDVRAAVGFQDFEFRWWSNNATGPLTAPLFTAPQHVTRTVRSLYGEVNIPIIGEGNAMPGIQALEINFAGRIDKYNDLGRTSNPKVGLRYTPVDGLVLHASYGTSFRSPNVLDLYQISTNLNVSTLADPTCGCNVVNIALSGGNPDIKPESADTYSAGLEWNPTFLPNFNASVNYFQIKLTNQIAAFLSDASILSKEAQLVGTGIITRVPNVAFVDAILAVKTVTSGTLPADHSLIKTIVDGRPQNLGTTRAAGIDIAASYRLSTEKYGNGVVGVAGEYFTKYEDKALFSAPYVDRKNTIFYPPKWRARYYVGWTYENWSGTATLNYLNSYTNTLVVPNTKIRSSTTTDLHLAYSVKSDIHTLDGLTLGLDVTNLFDQDPPRVLGQGTGVLGTGGVSNFGGAGFDPTKAYILGRLISFTIDKKF